LPELKENLSIPPKITFLGKIAICNEFAMQLKHYFDRTRVTMNSGWEALNHQTKSGGTK
jgi:hypothetical protein